MPNSTPELSLRKAQLPQVFGVLMQRRGSGMSSFLSQFVANVKLFVDSFALILKNRLLGLLNGPEGKRLSIRSRTENENGAR
jgi:hypothetical protein